MRVSLQKAETATATATSMTFETESEWAVCVGIVLFPHDPPSIGYYTYTYNKHTFCTFSSVCRISFCLAFTFARFLLYLTLFLVLLFFRFVFIFYFCYYRCPISKWKFSQFHVAKQNKDIDGWGGCQRATERRNEKNRTNETERAKRNEISLAAKFVRLV